MGEILTFVAIGIVVAIAAVWWSRRETARAKADAAIFYGETSPAALRRAAVLESPRARRRLADDLRWLVNPESSTPLDAAERRVLAEERDSVLAMADRIQEDRVDPRALVILTRLAEGTYDGAKFETRLAEATQLVRDAAVVGLPEGLPTIRKATTTLSRR